MFLQPPNWDDHRPSRPPRPCNLGRTLFAATRATTRTRAGPLQDRDPGDGQLHAVLPASNCQGTILELDKGREFHIYTRKMTKWRWKFLRFANAYIFFSLQSCLFCPGRHGRPPVPLRRHRFRQVEVLTLVRMANAGAVAQGMQVGI